VRVGKKATANLRTTHTLGDRIASFAPPQGSLIHSQRSGRLAMKRNDKNRHLSISKSNCGPRASLSSLTIRVERQHPIKPCFTPQVVGVLRPRHWPARWNERLCAVSLAPPRPLPRRWGMTMLTAPPAPPPAVCNNTTTTTNLAVSQQFRHSSLSIQKGFGC
jgi:hypothetical protein